MLSRCNDQYQTQGMVGGLPLDRQCFCNDCEASFSIVPRYVFKVKNVEQQILPHRIGFVQFINVYLFRSNDILPSTQAWQNGLPQVSFNVGTGIHSCSSMPSKRPRKQRYGLLFVSGIPWHWPVPNLRANGKVLRGTVVSQFLHWKILQ